MRAVPMMEFEGLDLVESPPRRSPQPKSAPNLRDGAKTETSPPRPRVRARDELTPGVLAKRADIDADGLEAEVAERLLERQKDASRAHAKLLADVSTLWVDRDDADLRDDREEMDLVAAIALRTTTSYAASQLRDAHIALTDLPASFERLAAGVMPVEWFDRLVRSVRALTSFQRGQVDERVAGWDLASIPADRFRRELTLLVAWFTTREEQKRPEELRDVALEVAPEADGTACVKITGPVPELLSFTRRLDQSARAVQDQQRRALTAGAPVPFDPDGTAAASGKPLPLAALRYLIMTTSVLETGAIEVPAERFRINVVVPVMTLLGVSEAPATLDGVTPIPAAMARKLAGEESTWYRVLADPIKGGFLPVPADQYRPTKPMLEHMRLTDPVCAVPGCDRVSSCNCEGDHIITFNHANPALGGRTCITNMHMLCWAHHRLKTLGLLDVSRIPGLETAPGIRVSPDGAASTDRAADSGSPPGSSDPPGNGDPPDVTGETLTHWVLKKSIHFQTTANRDLLTPDLAAALQDSWDEYMFCQEIQALIDNGEYDRIINDFEPTDPRDEYPHDDYDTAGRPRDPEPPY